MLRDLKKEIITLKSYLKQDNGCPPPPHNFILFQLDFDVKFPLLRFLLFLTDLKSTIIPALNLFLVQNNFNCLLLCVLSIQKLYFVVEEQVLHVNIKDYRHKTYFKIR